MPDMIRHLFSSDGFMPHGHCYLWNPALVWLHVISDGLTALAYTSIPFTLVYLARKRRDIPFNWMFLCFGMFIIACGATHVLEIWTLWTPTYWLSGAVKAITAAASVPTAILLVRLLPKALAIPTAQQLATAHQDLRKAHEVLESRVQARTAELTKRNEELASEIVERKRAEEALRKSEGRFRRLADSGIIGVVTADVHGNILEANRAFLDMVGYTGDDVLSGKVRWAEMTPPEWRHLDERAIEQLKAAGIATAWEKEYLRKDGSRVPILVGVAMLEGTAGEVIAFILDLTERKRAEAAVRSSEERFRRLTESGIVGIVLAETSGKIHEANDAFLKMVGYTREDLAAGRIRSSDLNPPGVQDGARRQLMTQGIAHPWEKELIRKDGSRVPVLIAVTMLDPPNCLNIILDLSEQKRAEAAIRRLREQQEAIVEANRMKGQFLANMSHELRTPLNAIIGFTELMHSGKVGPLAADQHEYLGDVLTSSRHLLQLINDILDLAKVESGKMEFRPEHVDLGKLVGEVRDVLRGLAAEKRLHVATQIDPQAGTAFIDPARVKQVLYNYLSNAIKFTSEGGLVTARIIAQETALFRLEVEDSGIGISPEDIAKLFVEFHQLDASSAKRFQGTGLGLAMTKRIVEALGGRVEVRSTPGKGSTFSAVLPREASATSLVEV